MAVLVIHGLETRLFCTKIFLNVLIAPNPQKPTALLVWVSPPEMSLKSISSYTYTCSYIGRKSWSIEA